MSDKRLPHMPPRQDDTPPPRLPRIQSQTDRDITGFVARKERELAAPHEVGFEDTAQIDDPVRRQEIRSGRTFDDRLVRVEENVHGLRTAIAVSSTKLDGIVATLAELKDDGKESRRFRRELLLKVAGGIFSGAVLGWALQHVVGC